MRCVMSSPAAAVAALEKRAGEHVLSEEEEPDFSPFVFETSDDLTDDETPTPPIEGAEAGLPNSDRRRLRELARMARDLLHAPEDTKLGRCVEVVQHLLQEGFHPIVWCRYVATAEYVAEGLRRALGQGVQVAAITGRIGDEERRMKIDEMDTDGHRVLVATDCLSEGINLQEKFTAVLHYDLPWNPNRLEQREGRVDRYGQTASKVKAVRFYGRDNPVDGALIEVLLDKAREIHKSLGTYVPVPQESETVMEAVLHSLFLRRGDRERQLMLFEQNEPLRQFHARWDQDAEKERINRTRFAQRAIKPEQVKRELEAVDAVLGDPHAVRDFVLDAAQRIRLKILPDRRNPDVFHVNVSDSATATLPDAIRLSLPQQVATSGGHAASWQISFVSPTPQGAEYVGRNHRFVSALARYLLEEALTKGAQAVVSRCGALRTRGVDRLTALVLLRVRYLIEIPQKPPMLSEEVLVTGFRLHSPGRQPWLDNDEALRLLSQATADANIPMAEKRELVQSALDAIGDWAAADDHRKDDNPLRQEVFEMIRGRARQLEESHKRIRKAVSLRVRELKVTPQFPPDLLGILVLQPMVEP